MLNKTHCENQTKNWNKQYFHIEISNLLSFTIKIPRVHVSMKFFNVIIIECHCCMSCVTEFKYDCEWTEHFTNFWRNHSQFSRKHFVLFYFSFFSPRRPTIEWHRIKTVKAERILNWSEREFLFRWKCFQSSFSSIHICLNIYLIHSYGENIDHESLGISWIFAYHAKCVVDIFHIYQ